MKVCFGLIAWLSLGAAFSATPPGTAPPAQPPSERMILEEKHFSECLAYVYSPALWISYKGALYFVPKDENQQRQIELLKTARSKYVALTNREVRYQLASETLATSGLDEHWQKKLLLPYSDRNPNLTPTLNRPFRSTSSYKVLQILEEGDALIQDGQDTFLVMDLAAHGRTNSPLFLVKEGERSFASKPGEYQRVEAFALADLTKEETAALNQVVKAFQSKAASFAQELTGFKATEEFEDSKARATDNNPYLQYMVARCYLDGKGVQKDAKLGLEWMKKAASNGSGDAKSYLEGSREKPSP